MPSFCASAMQKEGEGSSIDKSGMYRVLEQFPSQCLEAFRFADGISVSDVTNVIVTGMGGSAIAGDILAAYLRKDKLPVFVNRDYSLPKFATKKSLVIISSYSGNTEETVSCLKDALKIGCKIVGISSGGKIQKMCKDARIPFIKLPSGYQPRCALGYGFFPMLALLQNSKLIENRNDDFERTIKALRNPAFKRMAEELSEKLAGKIPLIYASEAFRPVAYRWKTQFNENAKSHAFYHVFPELDHNELVGYLRRQEGFYCIMLKDEDDHPRIIKRVKVTKELIKKLDTPVTEVTIKGDCLLSKLFSTIYMGDWTSYFLAVKYGVDPTPVKVIEDLKKQLG